MSRFDTKPEDYDKAIQEGEDASDAGSLFIQKRMKDDLDCIYIAFLEIPSFGTVVYDKKPIVKGQGNVVSFGKDGNEKEEGVFILEMAQKHVLRFLAKLRKPQYGIAKVYEIERHGVSGDQQTYYEMEFIRDLTEDEINDLEEAKLHKLFTRQDDTTAPAPAAESIHSPSYLAFNKQVVAEVNRLGWAKENVQFAIKTFTGGSPLTGMEMSDVQREDFVAALAKLNPGEAPASIGYNETEEPLDLNADVNFF